MREFHITFIAYSHPLCHYGLPLSWEFWQRIDLKFLAICDEVIVLKLDGWVTSVGVQAEIAAARALGKPVTFLEPVEDVRRDGSENQV